MNSYFIDTRDTYLSLLRGLVGINSFTGNPRGVEENASMIAAEFQRRGFSAERVPHEKEGYGPHLFLRKEGKGRPHVLISHLDTVYSPEEEHEAAFHWQREDGRIYGPGTGDIKGGTVAALAAVDYLHYLFPEIYETLNIHIALNSSEEVNSDHFGGLCRERYTNASAFYGLEAGGLHDDSYTLVRARKGRVLFHLECRGRGAHAGTAHHEGESAITHLAQVITTATGITDYEREVTLNTGIIRGGEGINRVASVAEAEGEIRAFDPKFLDEAAERLRFLTEEKSKGFCRVTFPRKVKGWPPDSGNEWFFSHALAAAGPLGFMLQEEKRGGLSDINYLADMAPSLDGFGPVGYNAHCSGINGEEREYILEETLFHKAEILAMTILAIEENER